MDYGKIKKGDYIYLFYYDSFRWNDNMSNAITIVTFKKSNERFYVFYSYDEQPHPTVAFEINPIVLAICIGYFYFIANIISPLLITNPTLYYILIPITLIGSYFCGWLPRLLFGVKKVDVSKLEKISTEEIKEKHMKRLWKSIYFPITFLIFLTIFNLYGCITYSEPINEFFTVMVIPIFYIGYLDIINRLISMIKIEKEYNLILENEIKSLKGSTIKALKLRKQDYVYLPMIDKPVRFLLGYPDVTSIVTFKNNNKRFLVTEKGEVFNKPKTITFPRRTIWVLAWILYFLIILDSPTTVTENLLVMQIISMIPLIIGLLSLVGLISSIDGSGGIEVENLEQISVTQIKEEYLKKIQKNLKADFLNSFVWIAYLIFIPMGSEMVTNFDYIHRLGLLGIILMLILRFINIYRRVVAVKEIEKEYKEL